MAAAGSTLPRWLGPLSRINLALLRLGLPIGTQHVLTVAGRRTGRPRSTPVSLVTVDGVRFVVSGEGLQWVANARAAGTAILTRRRHSEHVGLVELPPAERGPILRAFWHQVPHGRSFVARLFALRADAGPDQFEAAGARCPVFRIEPIA